MRRTLLATAAALAVVSTTQLLTGSAQAVTPAAPAAAMRDAADSTNLIQNVRWVCRWGYYGRRHCWWVPGYYRRWHY